MEWGMLGDEGLLSGSEEPPASPRLNLWSRKWDASGLSKSCQWEAEVSFLTVKDLKCRWCLGGNGGHAEFNEREESGAGCDRSSAEHEDRRVTELGLPGKLARGRGAQSWADTLADVEDARLDWGRCWFPQSLLSFVLQAVGDPQNILASGSCPLLDAFASECVEEDRRSRDLKRVDWACSALQKRSTGHQWHSKLIGQQWSVHCLVLTWSTFLEC